MIDVTRGPFVGGWVENEHNEAETRMVLNSDRESDNQTADN